MVDDLDLMSFEDAVEDAAEIGGRPHVLLGNGFSIACRRDCFDYSVLLHEAGFDEAHGDIRAIFELLGTTDFERVIELLRLAAELVPRYGSEPEVANRLRHDADVVREALAKVLAARHPDLPFDVDDDEYHGAREFLANFERIYTINYDMLLYWAVMQTTEPDVPTNDGFTNPDDDDADYVVWEPYQDYRQQRLFYLHGGLHLYDAGSEIQKITWSRTQIPLVDQIRDALSTGRYPLIVTEGQSVEKETKILHNAYLNHAIRSFAKIGGALLVYGHSLAPNDEHILRRIEEGPIRRLYVSIYDDPQSADNQRVLSRAQLMSTQRAENRPLQVRFYHAETAHVWG